MNKSNSFVDCEDNRDEELDKLKARNQRNRSDLIKLQMSKVLANIEEDVISIIVIHVTPDGIIDASWKNLPRTKMNMVLDAFKRVINSKEKTDEQTETPELPACDS